jgi:hypothetical protein
MADCFFGYQITEGYEVVRASHWCERFKPREDHRRGLAKAGMSGHLDIPEKGAEKKET